jgi:SAM-dependent methyltransferase
VFEVGIGTGRMAAPLAARGVRVTGIDISAAMLGVLRGKRGDIDAVLAESTSLPFRAGAFDAALFVHILHLVPDQEATLRAVPPLVKPGGALILGYETYDGIRLQADDAMEAIGRELIPGLRTGREQQEQNRNAFRALAEEMHVRAEHRLAAAWQDTITARAILDSNARRHGSGSWTIDEATMDEMLRRAEPGLLALFGDLERPATFNRTFELLVARVPERR